jgi:hypothetical protein
MPVILFECSVDSKLIKPSKQGQHATLHTSSQAHIKSHKKQKATSLIRYQYFLAMQITSFTLTFSSAMLSMAAAYPDYVPSCRIGSSSVGSYHKDSSNGRSVTAGTMADSGFDLYIDGFVVNPSFTRTLDTFKSYNVTVKGSAGQQYKGAFLALAVDGFDVGDALLPFAPHVKSQDCDEEVSGVHHSEASLKTEFTTTMQVDAVYATITLDVNIVVFNNETGSAYYHTQYKLASVNATMAPTAAPTKPPTNAPTKSPTGVPTKNPTKAPSKSPTKAPTNKPMSAPTTNAPVSSSTKAPKSPSRHPTVAPLEANVPPTPTGAPSKAPAKAPVLAPTNSIVTAPTGSPVKAPTKAPSMLPTKAPTTKRKRCGRLRRLARLCK